MGVNFPTVFIVDDDDAVRQSLRALLESYEFEVKDYASGRAFLSNYASESEGCILLDIHLPGMGGLEILNLLRGEKKSHIPVVMITGRSDKLTKERLLAAGASSYLEKPLDSECLISTIQSLISGTVRSL